MEASSKVGEPHPQVLTESDVNLSIHLALIDPPWVSIRDANEQTTGARGVHHHLSALVESGPHPPSDAPRSVKRKGMTVPGGSPSYRLVLFGPFAQELILFQEGEKDRVDGIRGFPHRDVTAIFNDDQR